MRGLLEATRANFSFSDRRRRNRHSNERPKVLPKRQDFALEPLESRLLLSANLVGVPDWSALGPGAITNASNVDLDGNSNPNGTPIRTGDAGDIQAGAIEAVAVDRNNAAHVAIGALNGGVWVTGNINAPTVSWTTNTDQM